MFHFSCRFICSSHSRSDPLEHHNFGRALPRISRCWATARWLPADLPRAGRGSRRTGLAGHSCFWHPVILRVARRVSPVACCLDLPHPFSLLRVVVDVSFWKLLLESGSCGRGPCDYGLDDSSARRAREMVARSEAGGAAPSLTFRARVSGCRQGPIITARRRKVVVEAPNVPHCSALRFLMLARRCSLQCGHYCERK